MMIFRVGGSGWKLKIATERLQDKKNNNFEEVSVSRKRVANKQRSDMP